MSVALVHEYNILLHQRNRLMIASLLLCFLSLVLGSLNWVLMAQSRTIVLPAEVNRSFWVSGAALSESYLEQMSQFLVHLLLNVTPSSFASNREHFLSYVAPQHFSALKTHLVAQQLEIERLGMSTIFYAGPFKINAKKGIVEVQGELKIILGNSPLESQKKGYRLQFIQEQGRLWLKSFEELKV